MTAADPIRRLLDAALADPASTAILTDFDGTLAPTVVDPAAARPVDGVASVLDDLARHHGLVAVVSGRPLSFLEPLLPASITISGQYGLELHRPDGERPPEPDSGIVRAVTDAAGLLTAGCESGVLVESKGLSVTVHWRTSPALETAVREKAAAVAAETGLVVHDAKASVELRPDVPTDKGTVLTDLVGDASVVVYLGDDLGDLPAFHALRALGEAGRTVLAVGVEGVELPAEVRAIVDVTVPGPTGAVDLLRRLADAVRHA